jgi:hypothetical protein
MAPVLQCPDCGYKHPLDALGDSQAFRCEGCGRMLKVPAQLLPPPVEQPPPAHFPPRRVAPAMRAPKRYATALPRVLRVVIWVVAVPLAFALVFGVARAMGMLSQRQLEDTFLETGWNRFWPVVRLLPFWALLTTLFVHYGNIGIARWRATAGQRAAGGGTRPSRRGRPINGRGARAAAPLRTKAPEEAPTRTSRVS